MDINEPQFGKQNNDDYSRPPSVSESIADAIARLAPIVDARVEWAHQDARARIDTHDAVAGIRSVGKALRSVYEHHQVVAEVVRQRADLSPAGKADALAKLAEEKAESIAGVKAALSHESARLLRDFPAPQLRAPTQEHVQAIELSRGSFAVMLPEDVEHTALQHLGVATAEHTSGEQKHHALQLLHHAFGPMLRRRAVAPESFAKTRQESAGVISRLIDAHLDSVTGGPAHRLAVAGAGRVQRTVDSLVAMLDKQNGGRWDNTLAVTMAGELDWTP